MAEVAFACATALPGRIAILRIGGPGAQEIGRQAGLPICEPGTFRDGQWELSGGLCPVSLCRWQAPRSYTGDDLIEVHLPGSIDVIALAVERLRSAGATDAGPGHFARRALANGKLTLDRAEALLAVAAAADATAARSAIERLRGALGATVERVRAELLDLRARVEAGLDFAGEDGVGMIPVADLDASLRRMRETLAAWSGPATTLGSEPVVCLVGRANAGKSALFHRLTGAEVLVSPVAGTTRDRLEALWTVAGRSVRLVDTAGWLEGATEGIEAQALDAGATTIGSATLVLACSAPDARLPKETGLIPARTLVIATKSDLGPADPRAGIRCSATTGQGLGDLVAAVAERLAQVPVTTSRQRPLLQEVDALLVGLLDQRRQDEALLAEDLRRVGDLLGDLLGVATSDEVLDAIFSRFCIGK